MTSLFSATLNQIANVSVVRRNPVARPNPNPRGNYKEGSATTAVLALMQENPTAFFSEHQLRWKTGFSHSAVSWALLRLKRNGQVDAVGNASVNPRFLRYRLKPEAPNA